MAKIGDRVVVHCECGRALAVKQIDISEYDMTAVTLVAPHKCVQNEQELTRKIRGMERTIEMYKTKLDNFNEFARLMKGLR